MSSIKIMTWNVLYKERIQNIRSLVKKIDPDIFCCQELTESKLFNKANIVKEISKDFLAHYYEPTSIKGVKGEELNLGNGVFAKFPIIRRRKFAVWQGDNTPLGNAEESRIYVEAPLKVDNKKLVVGTTHLSFAPYFKVEAGRKLEADRLLEEVKQHKSQYIITGDFNSTPDTYTIKKLEKLFKSAGPPHGEPTFTTIPFEYLGFKVTGLDWRIDYIFITPDIRVVSSKIVNTEFSDHLPIVAEIEI